VALNTFDDANLASMSFVDAGGDGGTVYLGLSDIQSLTDLGVDQLATDLSGGLGGGSDGALDASPGINHSLIAKGDLDWLVTEGKTNNAELGDFFGNLAKLGFDSVQITDSSPGSDTMGLQATLASLDGAVSASGTSFDVTTNDDTQTIEVKLLGQKPLDHA
jgi:hypothetical protein